ncbi:MAG: carboxypeptidase-like regulatory domain-containing protein [Bacteroidia bacterium]|nr:carboxypeptidase-like regulatory domain-containing protein [Bacteroidia bacterium]
MLNNINTLILGVLLSISSIVYGQRGKVSLKISDNSGNPIPYAQVHVARNSISGSANKQGICNLQLPKGNWNVSVIHPEYLSSQKRIAVKEGQEINLIVMLERRESPPETLINSKKN